MAIQNASSNDTDNTLLKKAVDNLEVIASAGPGGGGGSTGGLTNAELRASAVPVSVSGISFPPGGSTEAKQDVGNTSLASIDSKNPALVSGRVPVDGSGVTQPVSIAASVGVTGPLTDTQLRASAVPVSLSGSVATTGGLTDTQLRASAVPVDGSGVTQPISATNLDVALSTRLKPADTLAGVTAVGSITSPLPTGTNKIGNTQLTGGATSQALGLGATVTAYGNLRVTAEPGELFSDVFDGVTIDSNRWNTAVVSGMTLAQSSGNLTIGTTTTNSNSAYIDSVPTFLSIGINFLVFGLAFKLEAQSANLFALNQHRFIGFGDRPTSFDTTTPLKNAIGFEIGTDGQLYCVVYASGVNKFRSSVSLTGVNLNTLITPSTGFVRLGMAYRADAIIFYINTTEYPAQSFSVSTAAFSLPDVQALPIRIAAVNAPSGTVGASVLVVSNLGIGDTGHNGQTIRDGTYAFQRVKVSTTVPLSSDGALAVRNSPSDIFRNSFADVYANAVTPDFTLLQTGTAMTVNQAGGNLVIASGTTTNSETVIRSVRSFRGALALRYKTILSQRIVQNTFIVELADLIGDALAYTINSATSVTVTIPSNPFTSVNVGQFMNLGVITSAAGIPGRYAIASVSGNTVTFTVAAWPASGSGTLSLWGWNYLRANYNGATATSVGFDTQRRGWNTGDSTLVINTTASPGHVVNIQTDNIFADCSDSLVATNTSAQFASRGSRLENIPNDDVNLYVFIRVLNGTSAPATTTTWTLGLVMVEQMSNQKVFIAGASNNGANRELPVQVQNSLTVGTVSTVTTLSTLSNTTQLTPGVAAANLGKAEDAVAASGDVGVFVLGVRRDALVISASTTGDYNEIATDSYGSVQVRSYEKQARTYSAAALVTVAASATDIFTITGSATTTVFITRIIITAVATAATVVDTFIVKRSTADTAGTSTAAVAIPHDSSDAAGTATCLNYSANPTTGTLVGSVRRNHIAAGTPTGVDAPFVFDFGDRGRPVVLRGIAQVLAINLNGVTVTGGLFNVSIEWFEI